MIERDAVFFDDIIEMKNKQIIELVNKIEELEEMLKNVLVVKFKIGQGVFFLNDCFLIKIGTVEDIIYKNNRFYYKVSYGRFNGIPLNEYLSDDNLFATKEEAEEKIKDIKKEVDYGHISK